MAELTLDTKSWDEFWERFDKVAQDIPAQKRDMLDRVGDRLTEELRQAIRRSKLQDRRGRVQSWQNPHVGSGSGYVAVRADSVVVEAGGRDKRRENHHYTQKLNAGALTNFLNAGHVVRPPSGRSKRYRSRAKMARVPGLAFYQASAGRTEAIGMDEAYRMLDQLEEELMK